jgi:DNA adenine methylase
MTNARRTAAKRRDALARPVRVTRRRIVADGGSPPPFGYFGSKIRQASAIVGFFPEHQTYVEPFAGSAAVLLAKRTASIEVLNDTDHLVVNFFRVLRDRPDELVRVCELSPYSRVEHRLAFENLDSPANELEQARRFWVVAMQSYRGILTSGSWSGPTSVKAETGKTSVVEDFVRIAERLKRVHLECADALSLVRKTLLYLDPPYLLSTRAWMQRSVRKDYRNEMFREEDHRQLLEVSVSLKSCVVLSGRPDSLYDSLLADWTRHRTGQEDFVWINR